MKLKSKKNIHYLRHSSFLALALGASLFSHDRAFAQSCSSLGTTLTCSGSGAGVSQSGSNINVILDGTSSAMNTGPAQIINYMTINDDPMSLTTIGQVNMTTATSTPLIQLVKSYGNGDLSLYIGGQTNIHQSSIYGGTVIQLENYSWGTTSNTIVDIAAGAVITGDGTTNPWIAGIQVTHTANGISSVTNRGSIRINGDGLGINSSVAEGSSYIDNQGEITLNGHYNYGIEAFHSSSSANGLTITHSGTISGIAASDNDYVIGIHAYSGASLATAKILSSGIIRGVNYGIELTGDLLKFEVDQSGGLIDARNIGIFVEGYSPEALVTSSGKIVTGNAEDAKGIYVTGNTSAGLAGLELVQIIQGAAGEIINNGFGDESAAIYAHGAQEIKISASGNVRSTYSDGIVAKSTDRAYLGSGPWGYDPPYHLSPEETSFSIDILSGGSVQAGGNGVAIKTVAGKNSAITIHQGAEIGALSDQAIEAAGYMLDAFSYWDNVNSITVTIPEVWIEAAPTRISNTGTITGNIHLGDAVNTMVNEAGGLWNLRNFSDSDADGIRDLYAVARSDFGKSGVNSLVNNGTIRVLKPDSLPAQLDQTGIYLPGSNAHNNMSMTSTHAHIMGVNNFYNNGVIDLTANSDAGDVLVISGGQVAGLNGGGFFHSGGSILMNTVLNEGGQQAQSDILVVDNVVLGASASQIYLTTSGLGAKTIGDGILLVDVRGISAGNAFVLGSRVAAGAYEYNLYQGSTSSSQSWYLRSEDMLVSAYRVEVPVAAAIAPLAMEYGFTMLGTMHNRIGDMSYSFNSLDNLSAGASGSSSANPQSSSSGSQKSSSLSQNVGLSNGFWGRLIGQHSSKNNNNFLKDGSDYRYNVAGMQVGSDLLVQDQSSKFVNKAGLYFGYGHMNSTVDATTEYGEKAGSVKFDAYSLGGYWTHFNSGGWYIDTVLQGTWYSTDSGSVRGQNLDTDGWGVLASGEAGYSFNLFDAFSLEPQAQLVAQKVSFNSFNDAYGRFYIEDTDTVRGRLGFRMSRNWISKNDRPISLWATTNIWHDFNKSHDMDVTTLLNQHAVPFSASLKGTWAEIGFGATGKISNNIKAFASANYGHSIDSKDLDMWSGNIGISVTW